MFFSAKTLIQCSLSVLLCSSLNAYAVEWHGLLDLRAVLTDTDRSWTNEGMGKFRFDRNSGNIRLGQAFLKGDAELLDTLSASIIMSANDDRKGVVDVNEAWFSWNPVPSSPWKTRVKVGAFFPTTSLEIDYNSIGWTPTRTLSSSAINSWIGEELRTKGIELKFSHMGQFEDSPHDYGFTFALFNGNDPTGSLMAWRGWSISDRITGLREPIRLADLPALHADGAFPRQDRTMHLFREIDNRLGYYAGTHYSYAGLLDVAAMHYDNRGDPLGFENGQYSWDTHFDHLSMRLRPSGNWELLFQALRGETNMGPSAARLDFQSWYALASHPLGSGKLTLRYDQFSTSEHDIVPTDPNGENGRALALAYAYRINQSISLVSELLAIRSTRTARLLIGEPADQTERSFTTAIRWQF